MRWSLFPLFIIGILGNNMLCQAVQVNGHCYLQNQINNSGSRVLFQADSPGAVTDSTDTDSFGYYAKELNPGAYDIFFTHEGYYGQEMLNQLLFTNTTLSTITLIEIIQSQLSGALSGIITAGTYRAVADIFVPEGDSLVIEPGVIIEFDEGFSFDIDGYLEAVGTGSDSIGFLNSYGAEYWGGLDFNDTASDSGRLSFCFIQGSNSSGIDCNMASPTISNCSISHNSAASGDRSGGGIYVHDCSPCIDSCTISWNMARLGAGIHASNSHSVVRNSVITYNSTNASPPIGAGIYCGDSLLVVNCDISNNTGENGCWGAGIFCGASTFQYCTITGNSIEYLGYGGGVRCSGNANFIDCTISGNSAGLNGYGGGMFAEADSMRLTDTIVANNSPGGGILFIVTALTSTITYCDFYNNAGGNFTGNGIPPNLGVIVTQNANGDPCDAFYNIFLNPLFSAGYHLQPGSPCIDAGDPTSPLDPDSTIADIGAFYFDQLPVGDQPQPLQPTEFRLFPTYPNPFNASTVLSYSIPRTGKVTLIIYNVLGQQVATMWNGMQDAGTHTISWNAADCASGIYFVRLESGQDAQSMKLLLIK